MKVTIIYPTEPSYVFGLVEGLRKNKDLSIDLIGTDRTSLLANKYGNLNVINMRGDQDPNADVMQKISRIIKFYLSLFIYMIRTDSKLVHIHWPNKFFLFDYTLLNLFYKMLNKKLVYTAHNIDQGMRDNFDSRLIIAGYKFLYQIVDKVIVHNKFSKNILQEKFRVPDSKIVINKLGLNLIAPRTGLTKAEARQKLNISGDKKVILFFGGINQYKGLDILIDSFVELIKSNQNYILIIAGQPREKEYFNLILEKLSNNKLDNNSVNFFGFIPNEEVEKYFMAADCSVLPYRYIFQSGVHALSYAFGLPVIASDVGSFKDEDIIEGESGFVCKPNDSKDLMEAIKKYFNSYLYKNLESNREKIRQWANENYSWDKIGKKTFKLYSELLHHS